MLESQARGLNYDFEGLVCSEGLPMRTKGDGLSDTMESCGIGNFKRTRQAPSCLRSPFGSTLKKDAVFEDVRLVEGNGGQPGCICFCDCAAPPSQATILASAVLSDITGRLRPHYISGSALQDAHNVRKKNSRVGASISPTWHYGNPSVT